MIKKVLFFLLLTFTTIAYSDPYGHFDVIFNNGNFIAVGANSLNKPQIDISRDGINWQGANIDIPSPSSNNSVTSVACNKNTCVASLENWPGFLYSSDNGLNWKYIEHNYAEASLKVIFDSDKFIMGSGMDIIYSYDGLSWSRANTPDFPGGIDFFSSIAYNNNMYVAIAVEGSIFDLYTQYVVSSDGINWSLIDPKKIPIDTSASPNVITANNTFYFSNSNKVGLLSTSNFVNFGVDSPTNSYETIEFHNNIMFAHINNSTYTLLSNDLGKTWYPTDGTPTPFTLPVGNNYAYGNNIYVYTSDTVSKYSYDAIHWNSAVDKQK